MIRLLAHEECTVITTEHHTIWLMRCGHFCTSSEAGNNPALLRACCSCVRFVYPCEVCAVS